MGFFKNLFGGSQDGNGGSKPSPADIENMLAPLLRTATKMTVLPSSRPPENSQLLSHFGGQPYFEEGESWPEDENGEPLQFVFQVVNNGTVKLPGNLQLVQLYYNFESDAWDTEDDGWLVKTYSTLGAPAAVKVPPVDKTNYCEIAFDKVQSLPDWEGSDLYLPEVYKIAEAVNPDEPWAAYDAAVKKLTGQGDYQSQLGGYPKWVQGESTPVNDNDDPLPLLFQIDSEDEAGLMWGDVGLAYVFYDEATGKIEFTMQCH